MLWQYLMLIVILTEYFMRLYKHFKVVIVTKLALTVTNLMKKTYFSVPCEIGNEMLWKHVRRILNAARREVVVSAKLYVV